MARERRTRDELDAKTAQVGISEVTYPVQSVDRALLLLREFLVRPSITVSEASDTLGVSRSTAHRLLAMLQHHGFVQQDRRSKAYLGGTTLLEIGLAVVNRLDIRGAAQPSLQALVASTQETAHLVVLQALNVLYLDGFETPRALRAGLRIGATLPANCTSAGKAILASMPREQLREIRAGRRLEKLTPKSITSWPKLEAELDVIRERGWATNVEESEDGLCAVAAALPRTGGREFVRAALVVAGPTARMDGDRLAAIAQEIVREAATVVGRLALT